MKIYLIILICYISKVLCYFYDGINFTYTTVYGGRINLSFIAIIDTKILASGTYDYYFNVSMYTSEFKSDAVMSNETTPVLVNLVSDPIEFELENFQGAFEITFEEVSKADSTDTVISSHKFIEELKGLEGSLNITLKPYNFRDVITFIVNIEWICLEPNCAENCWRDCNCTDTHLLDCSVPNSGCESYWVPMLKQWYLWRIVSIVDNEYHTDFQNLTTQICPYINPCLGRPCAYGEICMLKGNNSYFCTPENFWFTALTQDAFPIPKSMDLFFSGEWLLCKIYNTKTNKVVDDPKKICKINFTERIPRYANVTFKNESTINVVTIVQYDALLNLEYQSNDLKHPIVVLPTIHYKLIIYPISSYRPTTVYRGQTIQCYNTYKINSFGRLTLLPYDENLQYYQKEVAKYVIPYYYKLGAMKLRCTLEYDFHNRRPSFTAYKDVVVNVKKAELYWLDPFKIIYTKYESLSCVFASFLPATAHVYQILGPSSFDISNIGLINLTSDIGGYFRLLCIAEFENLEGGFMREKSFYYTLNATFLCFYFYPHSRGSFIQCSSNNYPFDEAVYEIIVGNDVQEIIYLESVFGIAQIPYYVTKKSNYINCTYKNKVNEDLDTITLIEQFEIFEDAVEEKVFKLPSKKQCYNFIPYPDINEINDETDDYIYFEMYVFILFWTDPSDNWFYIIPFIILLILMGILAFISKYPGFKYADPTYIIYRHRLKNSQLLDSIENNAKLYTSDGQEQRTQIRKLLYGPSGTIKGFRRTLKGS